MRLIKPNYKIEGCVDAIQGLIMINRLEQAGRTCYKSEDKMTMDSAVKFVAMLIQRGHESVLEHEKLTVRFICDRGVSHEIVRHRLASFSQESTRYCDYNRGHIEFIIPPWVDVRDGEWDYVDTAEIAEQQQCGSNFEWLESMRIAEESYQRLCEQGWKPEQARSVLPNSLKTEIVVTTNLREWRLILKQRTANAAHPQMRELMRPLLDELKVLIPVVFDDISY